MSTERPPEITDADVRSLAAKLKGLHALSTPAEQELLRIVLDRAAHRDEAGIGDTTGFVWAVSFNPFTYLDAIDFDAFEEQSVRSGSVRRTKRRRTATSDADIDQEAVMTQITQEQREHFEAVAAQATTKLETFRDGLTADERAVLSLGLWQAVAEAAGTDESVAGFAVHMAERNPLGRLAIDLVRKVGESIAVDAGVSGVKAAWGWITAPSDSRWGGTYGP